MCEYCPIQSQTGWLSDPATLPATITAPCIWHRSGLDRTQSISNRGVLLFSDSCILHAGPLLAEVGTTSAVHPTIVLGNKTVVAAGCIVGANTCFGDKSSVKRSVIGARAKCGSGLQCAAMVLNQEYHRRPCASVCHAHLSCAVVHPGTETSPFQIRDLSRYFALASCPSVSCIMLLYVF